MASMMWASNSSMLGISTAVHFFPWAFTVRIAVKDRSGDYLACAAADHPDLSWLPR